MAIDLEQARELAVEVVRLQEAYKRAVLDLGAFLTNGKGSNIPAGAYHDLVLVSATAFRLVREAVMGDKVAEAQLAALAEGASEINRLNLEALAGMN